MAGSGHVEGGAPTRFMGDAVELDYAATLQFFERRATRAQGEPKITVTSYQDDEPDLAQRRDEAEWARVEPLLALDRSPAALDIGCGVGRWARHLDGHVARYFGVDFSHGLIDLARAACADLSMASVCRAQVRSAAEIGEPGLDDPGPFGLVIISGVLAYLNDEDVERCLRGVSGLLDRDVVLYLREPVGIGSRMTLRDHWSDELDDAYHAVYRSAAHYRDVLSEVLGSEGLRLVYDEALDSELQNRAETSQHFFVMRRGAS